LLVKHAAVSRLRGGTPGHQFPVFIAETSGRSAMKTHHLYRLVAIDLL
jgi:hypothetical protein